MKHLRKFNESNNYELERILDIARDDCFVDLEEKHYEEFTLILISPYQDRTVNYQNYAHTKHIDNILKNPSLSSEKFTQMIIEVYNRLLNSEIYGDIKVLASLEINKHITVDSGSDIDFDETKWKEFSVLKDISKDAEIPLRECPLVKDETERLIKHYSKDTLKIAFKCYDKLYERALPDKWLDENPDNYLNQKNQPSNVNITHNIELSDLKKLSWKDITVEEKELHGYKYYSCNSDDLFLIQFQLDYRRGNIIHTQTGLNDEYRGIGLGYKCYKAVINKVGWVSSYERSTNANSRKIWKYLIKDPDYYTFGVRNDKDNDGFVVIKKSKNRKHIKDILKKFNISKHDPTY